MQEVSKLQAAEYQLVTAIELFFKDTDPISVHTLARAAHEILDLLCKHRGLTRSVVYQGMYLIEPEKRDAYYKKLSEAKNFFKHANQDTDKKLLWNPEVTEHYLWDATALYKQLAEDIPIKVIMFMVWYRATNSQLWDSTDKNEIELQIESLANDFSTLSKKEAYSLMFEAVGKDPLLFQRLNK